MGVMHLAADKLPVWSRSDDQEVYLADLAAPEETGSLSHVFARYGAGASMAWTVAYDESIVVVKGAFSVTVDGQTFTAKAGEVLFVPKGTSLTYHADVETDMITITHPYWLTATEEAGLGHLITGFHDVARLGAVASEGA